MHFLWIICKLRPIKREIHEKYESSERSKKVFGVRKVLVPLPWEICPSQKKIGGRFKFISIIL